MKLVEVLIEYSSNSLNRPFSYAYCGDKEIRIGTRVLVPFSHKNIVAYVIKVTESNLSLKEYEEKNGYQLKEIISIIDVKPLLNEELFELANKISDYYFSPLIKVLQTMLPPSLKPKATSLNKPKIQYDKFLTCSEKSLTNFTKKQLEIYQYILNNQPVNKKSITSSTLKYLIDNGFVIETLKEKKRNVIGDSDLEVPNELTVEQKECFDKVICQVNKTFLLEGVTGSGKTEVYMHLANYYISQHKTVLMLIPEISLSFQMVDKFKRRFKRIAIFHSFLTDGEKYDEYRKIIDGEVDIVIGARSAIFAPLKNIGLIIIDEEHSETYKQENQPHYHAIKVAEYRKEYTKCNLLLGSATPSIESRARAFKNKYILLRLTKRLNVQMPETKIIDLKNYNEIDNQSILYSKSLRNLIQERLNKNEQVMLLINRRGYSPFVTCRSCGSVFKCPECNISLTYHKIENKLICHHCGYEKEMISKCPKCQSTYLKTGGYGSEKAESELKKLFPTSRILRLDSDIAKKKSLMRDTLEAFKNHEADILIGTQMIAKGHDFPLVTLSSVVQSDIGLNIPSFRAAERTFSLLTQAIGRAGRSKDGVAILQTYSPSNYVIQLAAKQDYESFFNLEMKYRKMLNYPPFCFCTLLSISSPKMDILKENVLKIKIFLESKFQHLDVEIVGPSDFFISYFNKKYRKKFILKYKDYDLIVEPIKELLEMYSNSNILSITIDVDPVEDY